MMADGCNMCVIMYIISISVRTLLHACNHIHLHRIRIYTEGPLALEPLKFVLPIELKIYGTLPPIQSPNDRLKPRVWRNFSRDACFCRETRECNKI